jgi:hypothetical protein
MRYPLVLLQLVAATPFFLSGCASVSVKDVSKGDGKELKRPVQIQVAPFVVDRANVKENPARKEPGQLGNEAQKLLQGFLVAELNRMGILSAAVSSAGTPPPNTWLVSGRITRLADGNRLLRMAIGLGSGGTKFETEADVRAGSGKKSLLHFHTTGGSNATPGGLTNPIPFSGVPTALLKAKDGITDDAARTARMIAGTIGNYMAQRGWVSAEKVPQVKMAREQ